MLAFSKQHESSQHRREKRNRTHQRIIIKIAAAFLATAKHHGSIIPPILNDAIYMANQGWPQISMAFERQRTVRQQKESHNMYHRQLSALSQSGLLDEELQQSIDQTGDIG